MMSERAVFLSTNGLMESDGSDVLDSATITSDKWSALRLLTTAGYTVVLFTPDLALARAGSRESDRHARCDSELYGKAKPLLQASYKLQIDLARSWLVGDLLDSIEIGRWVGCKTVLLADGKEREWDMTANRWPDLLADDFLEMACLIVMSDGTYVDGLSPSVDYDD